MSGGLALLMKEKAMKSQKISGLPGSFLALVLDDDVADRFRLIKICRQAGLQLQFVEAQDLDELQAHLNERQFDIIFIDFHLGLESGHQALELVRSSGRQSKAISIMVTSADTPDIMAEAMRNGCCEFILKDELDADTIRESVALAFQRKAVAATVARDHCRQDTMRHLNARPSPECRRPMSEVPWRRQSTSDRDEETKRTDFNPGCKSLRLNQISNFEKNDQVRPYTSEAPTPHCNENREVLR